MVCGCVRTKPHLGRNSNNNGEHETLNHRVVELSPTQYVIKPHVVA